MTLADEGAFDELHAEIEQRITALREAGSSLTRHERMAVKAHLLNRLLPALEAHLKDAQNLKVAAFQQANAALKAAALEKAGAAYTGVLLVSQIWQLYANIAVVTAWANEKGVDAGTLAERERDSPLFKLLSDFRNDSDIIALAQAGIYADVPAMRAALPAGRKAYELHIAGLDRWIASIGRGAILSSKVIQVANITLIAISIYQVWKLPAIPAGGTPTPPTILGTLPGGVAVGSTVSLPSLARAVEAIRKLVAIGALDGALIGGIGSLGGGPSIALPELQRPTSLSVQSGQGTGGVGGTGSGSGSSTPQASTAVASGVGSRGSAPAHSFVRTESLSGRHSSRQVRKFAESMRTDGWQGDPIKVVEYNGKRYIIDGHHRVEAARRAGIDVPYEIASPAEMAGRGYKSIDEVIRAAADAGPNRLR
ncbi:MAG TPA: ParB/RepB/Spo0J family partition protein [Polyangiaceae bacterium]|nr:ParB/RepB/Spo0J family partition protein [Polyangiaceae bacterium]